MSRRDFLWVGLNLLAAYMAATGCVQAGAAAYERSGLDPSLYSPNFSAPFGASEYRELVRGGLSVLAGAALGLAAWWVGRGGRPCGQVSDYADPPRPPNAAEPAPAPDRGGK
jgi:hypothetical protein